MNTSKIARANYGWPMNLMHEIFGSYRSDNMYIDDDSNLDITDIEEVERRIMEALNEVAIWEKDIILKIFRDRENITSVAKFYNISSDRVNNEIKYTAARIRKRGTRSHDILIHNDPEYTAKNIKPKLEPTKPVMVITLNTMISDLPLSNRAKHAIQLHASTIKQLTTFSKKDLSKFRMMGNKTINEIVTLIEGYGFEFAADK